MNCMYVRSRHVQEMGLAVANHYHGLRIWLCFHWPLDPFSITSPSFYGKATEYFSKV